MSALDDALGANKKASSGTAIDNALARIGAADKSQTDLSKSYGDTGKQSFSDQLLSKLSPLMNVADLGLNIVERPSQGILHALGAFAGQHKINGDILANAGKEFVHGLTDVKGEDNYNLRQAAGEDKNAGGRLAGLFDTIGTAAIDPVSYITAGNTALGKVGLKVVEEKLGKEVAETVAKRGIKALPETGQKAVREALASSDQAALKESLKAGGADKFVQGASGALEGGNGFKFAGKTVLPFDSLSPIAEAAHIPQALGALKESKLGTVARQAVVPFAKVDDLVGSKASEAAQDVIRQGRAAGDNATQDVLTQVRSALKNSGLSLDEVKSGLTKAIDQPVSNSLAERLAPAGAAKAAFVAEGKPEAASLVDNLLGIRQQGTDALRAAGADTGMSGQLQRSLTKETVKAIHRKPTVIARALGLDASATPANIVKALQRSLPNEDLHAANERLSSLIGVKNALETNPIKVLTDQTVAAHRDAAVADTLKGLMDVHDEAGLPLVSTVKRPGDVARETLLGTVYGPKEVLDELDHAAITLKDDHALKVFSDVLDKWSKIWRGYATVPVLFGLGFHERNLVGNVFNMWLQGFHDPRLFNTSDKILRAVESGTNSGLTADAAIDAATKLSPEDRQLVRLARKEGVISDSFFRTDQATAPAAGKSAKQRIGDTLNPVSMDNAVIKSGSYIGRRIEDNSRLAMFLDQMHKHGDPQIAAQNVKKALFDYSELTPSEKALKKVVPFYTYMRKNTPLQVQSILQNPGKFSAQAHLRDNLQAGAPDTGDKSIPQYALASGAIPLLGGDNPILGSLSTPYQAAAANIQPLVSALSQLGPENLKTEGGMGDVLRQVIGNIGGGPAELAKLGVEQATGKSLFTGQDIKPGTGLERALKALVPLAGKGDSTITDLTSGDASTRNARLLSALSGLSTTALTDARSEGEAARRAKALQGLATGTPTIAELRKQGKAPKAKASSKSTKIKKAKGSTKVKKVGSSLPKVKKPKP